MTDDGSLGFAEVDITPSKNVQMVGFDREDNLSKGVLSNLFAQISVWHWNSEKCCLVSIDHIGFMCEDANRLRDEIGNLLGIPREKVMLCFSHTHSAPNVSLEPDYLHYLCGQVLLGVSAAEKTVAPIKVAWGMANADIGVNRRDPFGALDRRLGIIKINDSETNQLRLLLLRVTVHANVLLQDNYFISSDFVGFTRRLLEEKYGCKVMVKQGASGNVKPKYEGSLSALDKLGTEINHAVAACVDTLIPAKKIPHVFTKCNFPFRCPLIGTCNSNFS